MPVNSAGPQPGGEQLFNRVVRLTVGLQGASTAQVITGLRVVATTHKSQTPGPATAEVDIYNLTKEHRAALRTPPKNQHVLVQLEAGYGEHLAIIFLGHAFFVDNVRQGSDWISRIQLMDGGDPYVFARVSQQFGAGTPIATVAAVLANALGPPASGSTAVVQGIPGTLSRGLTVNGSASKALTELFKNRGYDWRFEAGQVVIHQKGAPAVETTPVLTPTSGLIGSPEHGTPDPNRPLATTSLSVKCLLLPTAKVWGRVPIISEGIGSPGNPAYFQIFSVEHSIDSLGTPGSPWYTTMETYQGLPPIGGGGRR